MAKLSEIVGASLERAWAILFRPFQPKKWLLLGFAALLSGNLVGGCNLRMPNNQAPEKKAATSTQPQVVQPAVSADRPAVTAQLAKDFFAEMKKPPVLALALGIAFLIVLLVMLFAWLACRFSFIFLEGVARNDGSIKAPYKRNVKLGDSYFGFSMVLGGISLLVTLLLAAGAVYKLRKAGAFAHAASLGFSGILFSLLPTVIALAIFWLALAVVHLITVDFVLPVMYKERLKIMPAWGRIMPVIKHHKMLLVKYVCLKIGLGIVAGIIVGLASLAALFGLALPAILTVGLSVMAYFLFRAMRLQIIFYIIAFAAGLPLLLFFWFCLQCLCLPAGVFFRVLSLKLLAAIDGNYDLFQCAGESEVKQCPA
jgi:hypothetical protein